MDLAKGIRLLSILCVSVALVSPRAWGQPAPEWLRQAEMATCWDRKSANLDAKRLQGIPFLINGTDQAAGIGISLPDGKTVRVLADLYDNRDVSVSGSKAMLSIPAQSGRVYRVR